MTRVIAAPGEKLLRSHSAPPGQRGREAVYMVELKCYYLKLRVLIFW